MELRCTEVSRCSCVFFVQDSCPCSLRMSPLANRSYLSLSDSQPFSGCSATVLETFFCVFAPLFLSQGEDSKASHCSFSWVFRMCRSRGVLRGVQPTALSVLFFGGVERLHSIFVSLDCCSVHALQCCDSGRIWATCCIKNKAKIDVFFAPRAYVLSRLLRRPT